MPMLSTGPDPPASRNPTSSSAWIRSMSQRSDPSSWRTPPLGKRWTSSRRSVSAPTSATITRPEVAPRSNATQRFIAVRASSQEGSCDTGVDRDVQPGRVRHVRTAEHEHGVGTVLGQHLALEQGALGVELAEVLLLHAVDLGTLRAPAAGEDAGALDHAVGVHAVDLDAVLAELGREQPHLVGLVGLDRGVGDVVGPGEDGVL